MVRLQLRKDRGNRARKDRQGCDDKLSAHTLPLSFDAPGKLRELIVGGLRDLKQVGSCFCRGVTARMALKQFHTEIGFKRIDVPVGIYHPGWVRTDMGGGSADISVDEAVTGLMSEFEALDLATTGCFRTWDGRDHAF